MPADNSPQGLLLQSMGGAGCLYLTGTTQVVGNFFGIQALSDTTLAAGTAGNISGDSLVGAVIPAGATMFGQFTGVQISAGKAVVYDFFN
tara:strand:+ start:385 stop:654 length:270 start_codon:yes stop_codon:yes gene_type:complete